MLDISLPYNECYGDIRLGSQPRTYSNKFFSTLFKEWRPSPIIMLGRPKSRWMGSTMHNAMTKGQVLKKSAAFSTIWNRRTMNQLRRLSDFFLQIYLCDMLSLPPNIAEFSLARKRTSIWDMRLGLTPSTDTRTRWESCDSAMLRMR